MLKPPQIARDISYSHSAETRAGRALIRVMENATGRIRLIRRARGYEDEVAAGRDFWEVMVERYGLSLDVIRGSLEDIPREGPLILIANHPYGILDGLIMGHILSVRREGDFRILAHRVFRKARELDKIILPISFDETKEALALNLQTRREALSYLSSGGAIGIFPGGTVSTSATPMARPFDPYWRGFTARMIARSDAQIVPIYFDGHNSRLFQLASHLHCTLRMGLLIKEFGQRTDRPVRLAVGKPIPHAQIAPLKGDTRAIMEFLRRATYALAPEPDLPYGYGFEFEAKHKLDAGRTHGGGNI
ncbi:lysophospholipid acyltransferase family protein [Poseidonocella sedimentorum]|uniref:Putative hemolysin n=1 Tax=Poseidonocella sedimentorum TaxID=871652 RepID=A0A1I6CRG8_9RHOB|nr:lysophospholipid acyltransferase family protein [Poseidonocella sedimentorum]SFQ95814.1 Putative hemolysin [Poseidonocella sedimentorum]